ncbi:hypothetical protein ACIBTZ_20420 [Micromonospora sp. NPDC049460]|uniref:hypothetical protein n=1 Tax=unclassified Micromonospora TaxID=2617518 RepID=UPI00371DB1D4
MSISKIIRRVALGAATTSMAVGGLVGVASPASAGVHQPPAGCFAEMGWYYGIARCNYGMPAFQVLVRCNDGTYRTGPWLQPGPTWSQANCNHPRWATDVWVNLAD